VCQDHKRKWGLKCGLMMKVKCKMLNLFGVIMS